MVWGRVTDDGRHRGAQSGTERFWRDKVAPITRLPWRMQGHRRIIAQ
jgi:hypothetical protein